MAASFNIMLDTSGTNTSPGASTVTDNLGPPNIRFKRADNALVDANNNCTVPTSGTSYSRWKHVYMKCTVAPNTQVNNVKVYTGGTGFGTGITVRVADQTAIKNSGSSAGYDVSDIDDEVLAGNHAGISSTTDLFAYTSASPRTVTISESGNIINALNETTDYIVLQMELISSATSGNLADKNCTISWDEI